MFAHISCATQIECIKTINENSGRSNTIFWKWIFIFFSCFFFSVSMESSVVHQNLQPTSQKGTPTQKPVFDDISPHNVTAVVGQTAILHCRVTHVSDRTVNNIRSYDFVLIFIVSTIIKHIVHNQNFVEIWSIHNIILL